MSIGIHPVHRRMAELHLVSINRPLTADEIEDMAHCVHVNATTIRKLDELKQLSQLAYDTGDTEWHRELCGRIEKLQSGMDVF